MAGKSAAPPVRRIVATLCPGWRLVMFHQGEKRGAIVESDFTDKTWSLLRHWQGLAWEKEHQEPSEN